MANFACLSKHSRRYVLKEYLSWREGTSSWEVHDLEAGDQRVVAKCQTLDECEGRVILLLASQELQALPIAL